MPTQIEPGDPAPDFTATDQDGEEQSLSALRGRNVVLYFYPKDDTPGCTTEACAFRDRMAAFRDQDTRVIGVSVDGVESHRRFADKYGLDFPLLADEDKSIVKAYGVAANGVAARTTFLIDGQGTVQRVWKDVDPARHAAEIQEEVEAATQAA